MKKCKSIIALVISLTCVVSLYGQQYRHSEIKWTDSEAQWTAFTQNFTSEWRDNSDVIDGWDFSHPNWVRANSRGQINAEGIDAYKAIIDRTGVCVTKFVRAHWDDLEPVEGEYDFSSLQADIDEAIAEGYKGVIIRLYATVAKAYGPTVETYYAAPRWLMTKYPDLYILEDQKLTHKQGYYVDSYAFWDDRFNAHYLKFIEKLGETGIFAQDAVAGCYVCAISESQGEEFWLSEESVKRAKRDGALTEKKMTKVLKERFDAWADAATPAFCHKLIWVGSGREKFLGDIDPIVTDYAVNKKGFGLRGGWIEVYLQKLESEFHGQYIDSEGYLTTNENCELLSNPAVLNADEAEEFTQSNIYVYGDMKINTYRYFEAMLRALQMRINMMWINLYNDLNTNYAITTFVANELGCDVSDAPDAWVYLRQNNISRDWSKLKYEPCKNYERWLYQRDRDGGYQTTPAMAVDQDDLHSSWPIFGAEGDKYNYIARRTNFAEGDNKIGIAIDDRFVQGTKRVAIKVTYHDIGNVEWGIRYRDATAQIKELTCKTADTNKVKTATYFVDDADFAAKGKDFDFELYTVNGDVAFSFVRVIKLQ